MAHNTEHNISIPGCLPKLVLFSFVCYWLENSPESLIHIMLAHVPTATKMLSKRYTLAIFLDLGKAQKLLVCYSESEESPRSTL